MKLDITPVNKELKKALDSITFYDRESFRRIEKALDDGSKAIERGARQRVPVKSGKLKKSIFSKLDKNEASAYVGAKAPHAHLIEMGVKAKEVDLSKTETLSTKRARKGSKAMDVSAAQVPTTKRTTGYATKIKIPARAPRPFMKPAFDEERPKIVRAFEEAVQHRGKK